MSAVFQFPFLLGVPLLPAKRVIAIDPGNHTIKVLLAELFLDRLQIRHRVEIDLRAEKLVAPEEIQRRLAVVLAEIGEYPIALCLPQHATLSQIVDLPTSAEERVKSLIELESVKLRGLSDTKIISDHFRLQPVGRLQNPYWVSMCQDSEVTSHIQRLGLPRENVCEVISSGNALMAAYRRTYPDTDFTVLVNIGVSATTLSMMIQGQGFHAGSYAIGTDLMIESVANARKCSLAEAERLVRSANLFEGPEAMPALLPVIDGWYEELERTVDEWRLDHPELGMTVESLQFVLSGGGAAAPGLLQYLNRAPRRMHFTLWSAPPQDPPGVAPGHFAVAYGGAVQALGVNPQPATLLPPNLRADWKNNRAAQRVQSVNFLLLLLVSLFLAFGTWQKLRLMVRKKSAIMETTAALTTAGNAEALARKVYQDYEKLRPLLERRQQTINTLQSLALLQEVRSNRTFWYVLFADNLSYTGTPPAGQTNLPVVTDIVTVVASTNPPPVVRPGFIVELCIPEEGETMRRTLSGVVTDLKKNPLFRNVDSVPSDQRRSLAEPKTLIADRHFALAMELAEHDFARPSGPRKPPPAAVRKPLSVPANGEKSPESPVSPKS